MTTPIVRRETAVVGDAFTGTSISELVPIQVHYTLCNTTPELKAVSCVGRRVSSGGSSQEAVTLLTNQITDGFETRTDVYPLGPDTQPEPIWTTLPIMAQVLATLATARIGIGWSGVNVGSGAHTDVLATMAPHIGARDFVQVDSNDVGRMPERAAAAHLFFSDGLDNRELDGLLTSVPERSKIVLLDGISSSAIAVNFYDTVHKRSLDLITPIAAPDAAHYLRARRLIEFRLSQTYQGPPIHAAEVGQQIEPPDSRTVILHWT